MGRPRKIIEPGELTARQQEVLDLLAKGRTNAEIGEALGISLDGAKWHVSEIISRLGVDSREQAAEYWRERQRLPQRVGRRLTAPAWLTGVKLAMAVASGIAAIGIVAAVLLLARGGDDDTPAAPDETPAVSTPTSVATPGTPAASPTAGDGRIATYNNLPVYEITVAPPVSLPAGTVLYYAEICGDCNGGDLYRAVLNGAGVWDRGKVPVADEFGRAGYLVGDYHTNGLATFAVEWCLASAKSNCYKSTDPEWTRANRAVLFTRDAGASWKTICESPACALVGVSGDEAILRDPGGVLWLWPSGSSYQPPQSNNETLREIPSVSGARLQTEFVGVAAKFSIANDNSTLIRDVSPSASASYFAFPGGRLAARFEAGGLIFAEGQRSAKAAWSGIGLDSASVVVDLKARTVAPISSFGPSYESAYTVPVAVLYGPTFRVATGSDCLNVRDVPSTDGTSLDCLPDGEFVRWSGKTQTSGGVEWVSVEMLDGRAGWVAKAFVE